MTAPAENPKQNAPTSAFTDEQKAAFAGLTDSEKLIFLCEQMSWLTAQVSGMLMSAQRNPAFRMMMGRNRDNSAR